MKDIQTPSVDHETVNERQSRAWIRSVATWTFVGIVATWLITAVVSWLMASETTARFGETFGALNTLFSGLAFAGVILTVLMQRTELQIQREELRLQRKELESTRAELKRQADSAEQQQKVLEAQRRATLLSAAISGTAGLAEASRIAPGVSSDRALLADLQTLINSALAELERPPVTQPEMPLLPPSVR